MNRGFRQNPYARRPPFEQAFRPQGSRIQGPRNQGENMLSPQRQSQSPFNKNQPRQHGNGPQRHSTPFKSPSAPPMGYSPHFNQGRSPGYNNNRNFSFNNSSSPRFGGPPPNNPNRSFTHNNNRRQSGSFNGASPNTSWGRGGRHNGGNFMNRSGDSNPGGSSDINKYYKHSMVEDPWRNLTPVPVKDATKIP